MVQFPKSSHQPSRMASVSRDAFLFDFSSVDPCICGFSGKVKSNIHAAFAQSSKKYDFLVGANMCVSLLHIFHISKASSSLRKAFMVLDVLRFPVCVANQIGNKTKSLHQK